MRPSIRRLCCVAVWAFFVPLAGAADIAVTAVTVRPGDRAHPALAEVTLNRTLVIKEIEVHTVGGRPDIRFPVYVSGRGKVYPQVWLLTRQARDAIQVAITSGTLSIDGAPGGIGYRLSGWKRVRSAKLKAAGAVTFNDAVAIECKVIETDRGRWVVWPARRPVGGGKWIPQVILKDARMKDRIVADILRLCDSLGTEDKRP